MRSEARQRLFQSRRQRLTRLVFLLSLLLYVVFSAWIYISVTMSDRVHITALRGVSMLAGTTLLYACARVDCCGSCLQHSPGVGRGCARVLIRSLVAVRGD